MMLSELLDWIDRFCTDEGPQLIEEAGTDGVNAFAPTLDRLAKLAKSAVAAEQRRIHRSRRASSRNGCSSRCTQLASQLARAPGSRTRSSNG